MLTKDMIKNAFIFFACLMLCICMVFVFTAKASAEQTVIVIGGDTVQQTPVFVQPESAAGNGSATVVSAPVSPVGSSDVLVFSEPTQGVVVNPAETVSVTRTVTVPAAQTEVQPVVTVSPDGLRDQVFSLVNQARNENGLSSLIYSGALQDAADTRAEESASSFQHARPNGSAAETVITTDYTVTGENLIRVTTEYATAELMMETWMQSQTHRNNLLNASFRQMAVGVFESQGTTYVSLIFTD